MRVSQVSVLCDRAKCAGGKPVESLSDFSGGVPSMRIQSVSEYILKWSLRHPGSFTYGSLRVLKILSMNFKLPC